MRTPMHPTERSPEELVSAETLGTIDPTDLVNEMYNTPSIYGRYTELYTDADHLAAMESIRCDRLKAKLLLEFKHEGGSSEAGYKAMVEADDRYFDARMKVLAADARAKSLLHKTKAIDKKLNQLTNHGMRINTEMRTNPMGAAQSRWGGDEVGKND